jgi:methionine aminotransferase
MMIFPGTFKSKQPHTEDSIFAIMSKLANQHGAINLSQGFPDFDISEEIIDLVNFYMKQGNNQYAPMAGIPELRKAISRKVEQDHNAFYDPEKEITITAALHRRCLPQ